MEVRPVIDSKADDPFAGHAFTVEFEISTNGTFERGLAGRVRIVQLLDQAQRQRFLVQGNKAVGRMERPTEAHLQTVPTSLRGRYLGYFSPRAELEDDFWMRFAVDRDLAEWCDLIAVVVPSLVSRLSQLSPNVLYLGQPMVWESWRNY